MERDQVILGNKLKMIEKYIPSSPRKNSTPETPRDDRSIRGTRRCMEIRNMRFAS